MHAELVYIDYCLEVIEAKKMSVMQLYPRHLHQNSKYFLPLK